MQREGDGHGVAIVEHERLVAVLARVEEAHVQEQRGGGEGGGVGEGQACAPVYGVLLERATGKKGERRPRGGDDGGGGVDGEQSVVGHQLHGEGGQVGGDRHHGAEHGALPRGDACAADPQLAAEARHVEHEVERGEGALGRRERGETARELRVRQESDTHREATGGGLVGGGEERGGGVGDADARNDDGHGVVVEDGERNDGQLAVHRRLHLVEQRRARQQGARHHARMIKRQ